MAPEGPTTAQESSKRVLRGLQKSYGKQIILAKNPALHKESEWEVRRAYCNRDGPPGLFWVHRSDPSWGRVRGSESRLRWWWWWWRCQMANGRKAQERAETRARRRKGFTLTSSFLLQQFCTSPARAQTQAIHVARISFQERLKDAFPRWLGEIQRSSGKAPRGSSPMAWRDPASSRKGSRM